MVHRSGFGIASYEDLDNDGQYDDAVGAEVTRPAVGLPVPTETAPSNARGTPRHRQQWPNRNDNSRGQYRFSGVPPVADAGGPYDTGRIDGGAFAPVTLDSRGSTDPNQPCDRIVLYAWDTDLDGLYGADDNNTPSRRSLCGVRQQ